MKVTRRQLIKLIREYKEENILKNYDFSDYQLGGGNFDLPPETPEGGGSGDQNYPMILLSRLRQTKFFEEYIPDPNESEFFRNYRSRTARAELGSHLDSSEGFPQSRVSVEAQGEKNVSFNFGFRRFGREEDGTKVADYGLAQIVPLSCSNMKEVEDIVDKVIKFCKVADKKTEAELNREYNYSIKEYALKMMDKGFDQKDLETLDLDSGFGLGPQNFWERYTR